MKLSWKLINEVTDKLRTKTELPDTFKENKASKENTRKYYELCNILRKKSC